MTNTTHDLIDIIDLLADAGFLPGDDAVGDLGVGLPEHFACFDAVSLARKAGRVVTIHQPANEEPYTLRSHTWSASTEFQASFDANALGVIAMMAAATALINEETI
jgi:hypothetical protein